MKCTKQNLTLLAVAAASLLSGCASYEVNTYRGDIPGYYIRYELQEADRAVEAARKAGKDAQCPAEFRAAEAAKNNAYDVFRACKTEEGAALAKQATAKANALCPPVAVAPPPPPAAPSVYLNIIPGSVLKGESAKMTWTSQNADECVIKPDVGKVAAQGAMTVTPADTAAYTIVCTGAGGTANSAANIVVSVPAPPMMSQQKAAPAQACPPMVLNVQFDTNKSIVKPKYHGELKKLADFLKEFPKATGVVEGHTDSAGNTAANMKLSQRRADSVRNYLIQKFGIAPERISAKGFGPTKPVADNKTSAGKQKNRRIEANFNCEVN